MTWPRAGFAGLIFFVLFGLLLRVVFSYSWPHTVVNAAVVAVIWTVLMAGLSWGLFRRRRDGTGSV